MVTINLAIKLLAVIIWFAIVVYFFSDLYHKVKKESTKNKKKFDCRLPTPFTDKLIEKVLDAQEQDIDFREDDYYISLSKRAFEQLISENQGLTDPDTGVVHIFGIKVNQFSTQTEPILIVKR